MPDRPNENEKPFPWMPTWTWNLLLAIWRLIKRLLGR
jgi:hypothetical protein